MSHVYMHYAPCIYLTLASHCYLFVFVCICCHINLLFAILHIWWADVYNIPVPWTFGQTQPQHTFFGNNNYMLLDISDIMMYVCVLK